LSYDLRLETEAVPNSISPVWKFLHVFPTFRPDSLSDLDIKIFNKVRQKT
jgi:hypothetical protein